MGGGRRRPCHLLRLPRQKLVGKARPTRAPYREGVIELQEQSLSIPTTRHSVATIIAYLEQFAPSALAADWDNVGLLLGERSAEVRRVLTCLTVTPESAAEAIETGTQLIVTHHP